MARVSVAAADEYSAAERASVRITSPSQQTRQTAQKERESPERLHTLHRLLAQSRWRQQQRPLDRLTWKACRAAVTHAAHQAMPAVAQPMQIRPPTIRTAAVVAAAMVAQAGSAALVGIAQESSVASVVSRFRLQPAPSSWAVVAARAPQTMDLTGCRQV